MGNKVPWKTGMLVYLPVTSRPLISLQKEAVLSPCNFATAHLTACILNFYLPWTSRPMKRRTLSQRPRNLLKSCVFRGTGRTPTGLTFGENPATAVRPHLRSTPFSIHRFNSGIKCSDSKTHAFAIFSLLPKRARRVWATVLAQNPPSLEAELTEFTLLKRRSRNNIPLVPILATLCDILWHCLSLPSLDVESKNRHSWGRTFAERNWDENLIFAFRFLWGSCRGAARGAQWFRVN